MWTNKRILNSIFQLKRHINYNSNTLKWLTFDDSISNWNKTIRNEKHVVRTRYKSWLLVVKLPKIEICLCQSVKRIRDSLALVVSPEFSVIVVKNIKIFSIEFLISIAGCTRAQIRIKFETEMMRLLRNRNVVMSSTWLLIVMNINVN